MEAVICNGQFQLKPKQLRLNFKVAEALGRQVTVALSEEVVELEHMLIKCSTHQISLVQTLLRAILIIFVQVEQLLVVVVVVVQETMRVAGVDVFHTQPAQD
jgi:hypothetical protein